MGGNQSLKAYQTESQNVINNEGGSCQISQDQIIQNTTINISKSFLAGGFQLTNDISVSGSLCTITDQVNQTIKNIQNTDASINNLKGLWNVFGWSSQNLTTKNDFALSLSQNIQQTCDVTQDQSINGLTVNVTSSTLGGPMEISNRNTGAGCALDACIRTNLVTTQGMTDSEVSDSSLFDGIFGSFKNLIILAIVAVVGVIILIMIIKLLEGKDEDEGESKEKEQEMETPLQQSQLEGRMGGGEGGMPQFEEELEANPELLLL